MGVSSQSVEPELATEPSPVRGVSRNVFVLGWVSFFTDLSSEMLYPMLPIFLTVTLGTPVVLFGAIEGIAEGTAGLSKVAAGAWSDRLPNRRPLIAAGYALSSVGKLLLALSFVWPQALFARIFDRLGKGTRTAPRDALIADSSRAGTRGRAFGFHRALDTAGAVVGPLVGLGLLTLLGEGHLRLIFLIAVLPALASVALVRVARERTRSVPKRESGRTKLDFSGAPTSYWLFLGISVLFAFGNSSDAFLLLRASDVGLGLTAVILAYVVYNIAYTLLSFPAGLAADRFGQRLILAAGFLVFGFVYLGFAMTDGTGALWFLFAAYGLAMALTEGVARALISDAAPAERRGTFLGLYHTAIGLTAVVASVLAGVLWDQVSPAAPFVVGAATGITAAFLLLLLSVNKPAALATRAPA